MDIDTLILSGGSTKGISFLGSINYLIENDYIDKRLKNIKKIICVSASFVFILTLILLEYDYIFIEKFLSNIDFKKILNINDISLKNVIDEYGLINYNNNHVHIRKILKIKYGVDSMSLLKLFKLSNIHIIVKVVNVTEQRVEYIDHINNPKINILKLIQMTTAIPVLLKPIKYKNNLYQDGGLSGNCPIEINDSEKYLCIEIVPDKLNREVNNVYDLAIFSWNMYTPDILIRKYDKKNIKIDLTKLNLNVSNFEIDLITKKKLLNEGYEQTKEHFNY
tara:strand:- start:122 stop:955 length:834 start_codon:yes stop_codon:yes gene_type:complete